MCRDDSPPNFAPVVGRPVALGVSQLYPQRSIGDTNYQTLHFPPELSIRAPWCIAIEARCVCWHDRSRDTPPRVGAREPAYHQSFGNAKHESKRGTTSLFLSPRASNPMYDRCRTANATLAFFENLSQKHKIHREPQRAFERHRERAAKVLAALGGARYNKSDTSRH